MNENRDKLSNPPNPKDIVGTRKIGLQLVPDSLSVYDALAFTEGALKYGQYNWRIAGVRVSVYISALRRHIAKFMAGEWADSTTGVPHLASARACLGIVLDAKLSNKLIDDRPPAQPGLIELIDKEAAEELALLKELFKDENPHQFTIEDTPNGNLDTNTG